MNFRDFDVLWGDFGVASGEPYGRVSSNDSNRVYQIALGQAAYSLFADFDGTGVVSYNGTNPNDLTADYGLVRSRFGRRLV